MLGAALAASLLSQPPALAAPFTGGEVQKEKPVPGHKVKPGQPPKPVTGTQFQAAAPVWPAAGTAELDLAAGERTAGAMSGAKRAGTSPLWVRPASGHAPAAMRVHTYDRAASAKAGSDGVVFRVSKASAVAGVAPGGSSGAQVALSVDYSAFQWAYGADWSRRLRLTELPECALTTPSLPECQGRPVETARNQTAAKQVSAIVPLSQDGGGTVYSLSSGPSGDSGSYAATSLSSSGTWEAGSNSGDFSWSYPMRSPPGLGGPQPSVALSYSSSSVDGRMAASNNQPSWAGEGWDLGSGFIERQYRPCSEDMTGGNNATKTGDLCWATDNATMSLAGHAGELLVDGSGIWHLRSDDGTRVKREYNASNGARNGEHWVVTTPDGTQYFFGNSSGGTLTVPVAGNHNGEPCKASAFADSFCTQAWRWYLEKVVDTRGNSMTYTYAKETNKYAKNLKSTDPVGYDRAAYLKQIDYGTRTDRTETAPMQVVFEVADRCKPGTNCAVHDANSWPDTPWDSECTGTTCMTASPTFWTTKRLASVTTKAGGRPVESWTLTHGFPSTGDTTRAGLWLEMISHKGLAGTETPMPDVTFAGEQLANRVDSTTDGYAAMNWWRVTLINTDTGSRIGIKYKDKDCVAGSRMPDRNNLQNNKLRCYPVRWTPEGKAPIVDFFHKYVVDNITESDLTGSGAPRKITQYQYTGDPAWKYTDDDGLVAPENKTWSVWRGYGGVIETKGDPGEQTIAENRYYRGMGGTLPAAGKAPAITDEDAFAGAVREKITYNGPGQEVSAESFAMWQSKESATRTINSTTVYSRYTGVSGTYTRTALDGGRQPRTTTETTKFDEFGAPTTVDDAGDDAVTGDESCQLIDYNRNTGAAWLLTTTKRVRAFAANCARAGNGMGLTDAEVISDDRTYYDNQGLDTAPAKGQATKGESLRAYNGGNVTYLSTTSKYDSYGRVVESTDARGNLTTSAYTPAAGGPVTAIETTSPLGWKSRKTLEPAWGVTLTETDQNQKKTEYAFDGLGRVTSIWKPGRDRAAHPSAPSLSYSYLIRNSGPNVVTGRVLNAAGGYIVSHKLFDGLLRERQNQSPDKAGSGKAIVVDTRYDTAGRAKKVTDPYTSESTPGTDYIASQKVIPVLTVSEYDGAARVTASVTMVGTPAGGSDGGSEKWRTSTYYAGDRIDSTPPAGDTVTSKVLDAQGRTAELRQYHAGAAAGSQSYDVTRYQYTRKGQLEKVTDPGGSSWTFGYDLLGNTISTTDPDKGPASSTYNEFGDELTSTDARNLTLAHTYDTIGRKKTLRDGSQTGAIRAEWTYDTLALGQLTKSTRYAGAVTYTQEATGFTDYYAPTGTKHTVSGSPAAGVYQYDYSYNVDGSRLTTRLPALGSLKKELLTYGYDAFGQPTTVKSTLGLSTTNTDLVTGTEYTSFGELGKYQLKNNNGPSASVTRTYESDTRRLSQIWTATATGTTADVRYSWDPAGNLVKQADVAAGDTQCFKTDHLRRMTEAWTPGNGDCAASPAVANLGGPAKYWHSYGFNKVGDRTSLVEHGTPNGDRTTTYELYPGKHGVKSTTTTDSTGSKVSNWTYDETGNTRTRPQGSATQTLTWDPEGHLASNDSTSYVYDPTGARILRTDPLGTTLYLPNQELRYTNSTGVISGTRYYSHAGIQIATRAGSTLTWLSGDRHGTAQITIDAVTQAVSTRRETPFGGIRATTGTWPSSMDKGFVGGTNDNTGLTHLGAREYDPALGRFISVDPEFESKDPQQLNPYTYSNNNPVTLSDPSGTKWSWGKALKIAAVVVAVVAVVAVIAAAPVAAPLIYAGLNAGAGALMTGSTLGMAAATAGVAVAGEAAVAGAVAIGSGVVASSLYVGGKIASTVAQSDGPLDPDGMPASPRRSPGNSAKAASPAAKPADRVPEGFGPAPAGPLNSWRGPQWKGRPDGQTVLSGHGSWEVTDGWTRVPEGTTVHFYSYHGWTILDEVGGMIERGVPMKPLQTYKGGDMIPNYVLHPPFDPSLNIRGNPYVPRQSTKLKEILKPGMGDVHWAACAGSGPAMLPPAAPGWNRGNSRNMRDD
ncbi:putative adhesin [Longispora albida]|uniref:putative adhesin n=1 Tax=Longispora albida TaxID=203523 RepID=UPI00039A5A12|nr:RHS repeat-associated core domain-containing protein [Longispora albida]